jgi:phytoene dehydrogenase-like protein
MIGERCLVEGTGHVTPIKNLFMCGASCHPGPGVTFLPGYNCAHEVMAFAQRTETSTTTSTVEPAERAA